MPPDKPSSHVPVSHHQLAMSSAKSSAAGKSNGAQAAGEQAASSGSRQRSRKPGRPFDSRSHGRFVPYLPHEDAVAAGVGEREGSVDVSASQEVTELLNAELSALLRLKPHQFWKHATSDDSLQKYLESYLRFRRRWYDFTPVQNGEAPAGIVVGDNDLFCRTFKVLFRMSSFHESRATSTEISLAKEPARLLFEKGLLDVPKLMDICAIYGHDNPDLTRRLVSNVLSSIPNVADEISAIVPPLVHTVDIMHRRCENAVQEFTRAESSTGAVDVGSLQQQLVEVLDYLNDVVATISAFIHAYPLAASILATYAAPSNVQGPFLPFLAGIYDSLLPLLGNGLSATFQRASRLKQHKKSQHITELRLKRLRLHLANLAWEILRISYLGTVGVGSSSSSDADQKERSQGVQGDFVVQAVVSLAIGVDDKENFSFGSSNGLLKLTCTGSLLKTIERKYGLCERIRQLCHSGELILDDVQYEYLASLAIGQDTDLTIISKVSAPQKLSGDNLNEDKNEPLSAAAQSKVQEVRDIFPAFGSGFILACLEVYDNYPEKVIQNILEGTLYPDLACLETWLEKKPSQSLSGLSGKDKGKKILLEEQALAPNKTALVVGAASSSSQVAVNGVATVPVNVAGGETFAKETGQPIASEVGKGSSYDMETRVNQAETFFVSSTGALVEYDDEYDDSFDDLVTYPGDTGLEETGNLDEILAHSAGFDAGNTAAWRRQEDPAVPGPSWSRKDGFGDRRKSKPGTGEGILSASDTTNVADKRARPGVQALGDSVRDMQMRPPTVRGTTAQGKALSAGRGHEVGPRRIQPSQPQYKVKEEVAKHGVVGQATDETGLNSVKSDSSDIPASNLGEAIASDEGVPASEVERREGNIGGERGRGGGYRRRREYVLRKSAAS